MENILILITWSDWEIIEWKKNGIQAEAVFKSVNKLLRGIRRIWFRMGIPFQRVWYENWMDKAKSADTIIIHVTQLSRSLCSYINQINPSARVIAWHWGIVDDRLIPNPKKLKGKFELWTFDPDDCKRYDMRFNHQYYFKSLVLPDSEILYDIYFCGNDANRGQRLAQAYDYFRTLGLRVKFQVVRPRYKGLPKETYSERVDYLEVRGNIARSRIILEIIKEGQSGSTLRVMESIYFQKKLITDNPNIKNEEFYNPNNIFVIGTDYDLEEFLKKEFVPYEQKWLDLYDVKQWIKNFLLFGSGEE